MTLTPESGRVYAKILASSFQSPSLPSITHVYIPTYTPQHYQSSRKGKIFGRTVSRKILPIKPTIFSEFQN